MVDTVCWGAARESGLRYWNGDESFRWLKVMIPRLCGSPSARSPWSRFVKKDSSFTSRAKFRPEERVGVPRRRQRWRPCGNLRKVDGAEATWRTDLTDPPSLRSCPPCVHGYMVRVNRRRRNARHNLLGIVTPLASYLVWHANNKVHEPNLACPGL